MEDWDCTATIKFSRCSRSVLIIQESRMRENLMYGLTRVQGKQSFNATAPLSYSTIYGNFTFDMDISNTSSNNRMLRQIYCSLNFSDKTLKKEFDDVDSKRIVAAKENYEKVVVLNLHSKSIVKKKLSVYLPKEDILNFWDEKVRVGFTFTKLWGIKKTKINFNSYFIKWRNSKVGITLQVFISNPIKKTE